MNKLPLEQLLEQAIWMARSLYDRGKTSGSSANLSFLHGNDLYITTSGSCFGNLSAGEFTCLDRESGRSRREMPTPSKELPLHQILYRKRPDIRAVLHIHSTYATLWSCLEHPQQEDVIPAYTPYLDMKLGPVNLVPYAPPGSQALFTLFEERVLEGGGHLLQNHGPIVGGSSLMDAYYAMEELEESARLAWLLRGNTDGQRIR